MIKNINNNFMKVKIGIDIDNVISDSYPAYLNRFNLKFDMAIRMEQIREFYFLNKYVEDNKVKYGRKMVDFIDEMVLDEKFQMEIPPIEDARRVISGWKKVGYEIHFVTSRPKQTRKVTINWLVKHGFWAKGIKIDLFDGKSWKVNDVPYKRNVVIVNDIKVFIEDSLEIARGMDIPVFLLDRPWNQGKLKKNITRVFSWQEIAGLLPKVIEDL